MEQIIDELTVLVENACKSGNNAFGYGIWSHHIKPMIPLGQNLADEYHADKEIVTISILLHDLAAIENKDNVREHHIIGAERAEKLLQGYNYPNDKTEKIKMCILNHRSSINMKKNTIEEICVADADAIIHLFELGSLFYMVYVEMERSIEDGQKWIKRKLEKDFQKLSERSKDRYRNEFDAVMRLLETNMI